MLAVGEALHTTPTPSKYFIRMVDIVRNILDRIEVSGNVFFSFLMQSRVRTIIRAANQPHFMSRGYILMCRDTMTSKGKKSNTF